MAILVLLALLRYEIDNVVHVNLDLFVGVEEAIALIIIDHGVGDEQDVVVGVLALQLLWDM